MGFRNRFSVAAAVTLVISCFTCAADISILPGDIALSHAGALQQLVIEQRAGDQNNGDLTAKATFASSDPAIATVDAKGIVHAVGNGDAVITATVDGQTSTTKVSVANADHPYVPSFRNDVQPLLLKMGCSSGACHGAAAGKNGFKLSLRGFNMEADHEVLTRQANGRRISLAEPEQSLALLKPTMQVPHGGGARFDVDSAPYRLMLAWIKAGAPPATPKDVQIQRVVAFPKSATLKPGDTQQVLVSAQYSDGSAADVSQWVKFATTDENVAVVDDMGKVTVKGPGAVAITVWYASKVTSLKITVPREAPVAPDVFAKATRRNYIDDLVLKQLESLRIAPATTATDTEFIRRVYIDAMGVLPTPRQVFEFVMNNASDKRDELIDGILKRPEFTDYWTYKWSDLLLLSSKNIPRKDELTAFYQFIHRNVADNTPWDAFVHSIITATGSTTENGAANYFVMHREPIDLSETTSQAFLGMSVTCARCHNHPLEKWTQDDYYGMANLFARIKLKDGPDGKDTEVLPSVFGDILHPRLGKPMPPKPLDGIALASDTTVDRREYLAQWLTSPDNPYFTRAIVNRIWKNYMGRGLVDPEDDLRLTNPASNEDLLDAMAKDLAAHKYDLRYMMKTIMQTAAYQRSSEPSDPKEPDGKNYSQYIIRRLSAEVLLDAYSQVTAVPTAFDGYPAGFHALQLPDSQIGSKFLAAFGRPQRVQTCSCERTQDSNVAQALHVANGDTLNDKLRDAKSFLSDLVDRGVNDDEAISAIYVRSLARYPNANEKEKAGAILATIPKEGDAGKTARRQALEDLAWAVLSSKEFIFNH